MPRFDANPKPTSSTHALAELSGARVVVTGATGFIGRHVMDALDRVGAHGVAVVDRVHADRVHADRGRTLLSGPELSVFDDPMQIAKLVAALRPDYVIHLYAEITTERTVRAIESTLRRNLLPSIALMEACIETKVRRMILMGSGEEFGPVTGPFDDSTIPDPPSPYGASKAATTSYAKMFYRAFELPVTVLRPTVAYGPFQSPRMLIPQIMDALRANRPIDVTEGRQTRDFIHVSDVAEGLLTALVRAETNGRSYNLGSGEVVTVKQCLSLIEEISGRKGLIRFGALPYKKGEIFSYEPLLSQTESALGWKAETSLRAGLASTWNWFVSQGAE
ncbi:NAD-dependent epimerase/dehydratase family protein [Terriglobus sp.]|uniref:NAD-dependent epimerase/dehydratase family protein n=1 Tax=Terriglobus sp. TaxID=1889013 RepID=UPI003B00D18B